MSNPLTPQTVYVPVDAKDELPEHEGYVHTIGSEFVSYFHKIPPIPHGTTKGFNSNATHWLKEQSLYIFTRAELEELREEAFEAGRSRVGGAWNEQIKNWSFPTFNDYKNPVPNLKNK